MWVVDDPGKTTIDAQQKRTPQDKEKEWPSLCRRSEEIFVTSMLAIKELRTVSGDYHASSNRRIFKIRNEAF